MKKEIKSIGILCVMLIVCAAVCLAPVSESVNIDVSLINQDPDPAEPGKYVEVKWKVENAGSSNAENVIFEVLPKFPFSLDLGESATQKIGSIWGRQIGDYGVIVTYRFKVDENAVEGQNEIEIRYSLDNGISWQKPGKFYINIRTHDAILNVKKVSYTPDPMPSGKKTVLSIELENMADSLLKDIKVNLVLIKTLQTATSISYDELPFSCFGTTNQQVIKNIGAGKTKTVEFTLIPDPDADADVYKIPITIQYSDELGTNYSKSEIISVIVGDEPILEPIIDSTSIYMKGQVGEIDISFVNKGTTDVKLLDVELKESDYVKVISSPKVYLGNIDSDDYEIAEFKIYVKDVDDSRVPLIINYNYFDPTNNKYEKQETLYLDVYSKNEAKKYGLTGGKGGYGGIFAIIIIVVIGYFGYRWWKKRKKKHQ
ncbi:MAG: hypothetical protein KJ968_05455 [Nanoarchaeota archaeon]|nr:hypothetical protein [Nanoarchaeota archaeon]